MAPPLTLLQLWMFSLNVLALIQAKLIIFLIAVYLSLSVVFLVCSGKILVFYRENKEQYNNSREISKQPLKIVQLVLSDNAILSGQ